MAQNELTGLVARERYRKADFVVAELSERDTDGNHLTVKGSDPAGELEVGATYRFAGRWQNHPKHGRGFSFASFARDVPHDRRGLIEYVVSMADGVGAKGAEALWSKYGPAMIDVLIHETARVVADGVLTEKAATRAARSLAADDAMRRTKIDLMDLLVKRGLPAETIEHCVEAFGVRGPALIRANPFVMLEARIPGVGFLRADRVYRELGLPLGDPKRQMYAAWHCVASDRNGHTWLMAGDVCAAVRQAVGDDARPTDALTAAVAAGLLAVEKRDGLAWVADYWHAKDEVNVATCLARVLNDPTPPRWPQVHSVVGLYGHQRNKLKEALLRRVGVLAGSPGTGKAQPLDAKLLTPSGWKLMGDVRVGDAVIGRDGLPHAVVGVFPQGEKDIFRMTFSDGVVVECCEEHLWLTQTRHNRKRYLSRKRCPFVTARVRSLKDVCETLLASDGQANHSVPMIEAAGLAHAGERPLDPYVLGALIGNGCFTGRGVHFSSGNEETVSVASEAIPANSKLVLYKDVDYGIAGITHGENAVLDALRDLGLHGLKSTEKFIPDAYKFGPVAVRLAVLQGLCDTGGSTDGCHVEYSTSSPKLAEDVRFLVESLGGTAVTSWRDPDYVYEGEQKAGARSARISVNLPAAFLPFRLSRKREKYVPRTKYAPARFIVSVEPAGTKQAQCITIDAPDSLYVTDHCVVTHNSYTASALIECVLKRGHRLAVCAPTGKAAVRITELMALRGLNIRATTVHALLRVVRKVGGGLGFEHGERNPLDLDYIFVDEMSMLSLDLFASLLHAIGPQTHLLLVGDPYQLPPVGHGAPLRDMLLSRVPRGELTEIQRNDGAIVAACKAIKDRRPFVAYESFGLPGSGENFRHVEVSTPDGAIKALRGTLRRICAGTRSNLDPTDDVQVICLVNGKTLLSRQALNTVVQEELNPKGRSLPGNPFRVGDKIICLANGWQVAVSPADEKRPSDDVADWLVEKEQRSVAGKLVEEPRREFVANGDIGRVRAVSAKHVVASFSGGRVVRATVVGRDGPDDDSEASGFALGYVITSHRAQGSSWPFVIFVGDMERRAQFVASRELFYTALSRGEKFVLTIGRRDDFDAWTHRGALMLRKTFLKERLEELAVPPMKDDDDLPF